MGEKKIFVDAAQKHQVPLWFQTLTSEFIILYALAICSFSLLYIIISKKIVVI